MGAPMSKEITLNSRGMLRPTTMGEAMEFSQLVAASSLVPSAYRGKPADVLLAIQMGAELGLAPMQALQSIAVVNGKPSVYGDALMALVRSSPLCESVAERFDGDGDNLTAICVAKRRGQDEPVVGRFSVADAKKAKLWGKAGPWTDYPKIMLKHRARGFCLRDGFADLLRGVITREEAEDYPVDVSKSREPIDITPKADLDRFAAAKPAEITDVETGEVFDEAALVASARAFAHEGWAALSAHLRLLTDEAYDILRPLIGTREQPGELRSIARAADERRDPLALDPDPESPHSPAGGHTGDGSPTLTQESHADRAGEPWTTPAGEPRARDDEWWNQERVTVAGKKPGEIEYEIGRRAREARNWAEIERLRDDNPAIDQLPKATREAVLGMLADRERELRADG